MNGDASSSSHAVAGGEENGHGYADVLRERKTGYRKCDVLNLISALTGDSRELRAAKEMMESERAKTTWYYEKALEDLQREKLLLQVSAHPPPRSPAKSHPHASPHAHAHAHAHAHIRTRIHAHTHTYAQAYTHTHLFPFPFLFLFPFRPCRKSFYRSILGKRTYTKTPWSCNTLKAASFAWSKPWLRR